MIEEQNIQGVLPLATGLVKAALANVSDPLDYIVVAIV